MSRQTEKVSVEAFYKNLAIVWFALFVTQFIFMAVVYFKEPTLFKFDFSKPLLGEYSMIIIIFAIAAVFNLIISFALKKKFLAQSVKDQNIQFVKTAMIVGCAMCEVVSLLGLMLAFVAQYQYFFIWIAIAAVGMIFHFPSRNALIDASYKK